MKFLAKPLFLQLSLATILVLIFGMSTVMAYQPFPSTGTMNVGQEVLISLTAAPPENSTGVQLDFDVQQGLQIVSYTPPTGGSWDVQGVCPGNVLFSSTSVCTDLTKTSGNVLQGESLGTLTIQGTSGGTWQIIKTENDGYIVSSELVPQPGILGEFTVIAGVLPNTNSLSSNGLANIGAGLFLIAIGVSFVYNNKKYTN